MKSALLILFFCCVRFTQSFTITRDDRVEAIFRSWEKFLNGTREGINIAENKFYQLVEKLEIQYDEGVIEAKIPLSKTILKLEKTFSELEVKNSQTQECVGKYRANVKVVVDAVDQKIEENRKNTSIELNVQRVILTEELEKAWIDTDKLWKLVQECRNSATQTELMWCLFEKSAEFINISAEITVEVGQVAGWTARAARKAVNSGIASLTETFISGEIKLNGIYDNLFECISKNPITG